MYVVVVAVLRVVLGLLGYWINEGGSRGIRKLSVFECGFETFSGGRIPFSLQFFLVSIVFIIFDIEIALILPFSLVVGLISSLEVLMFLVVFIALVVGGLYFEWGLGCLGWYI